MIEVFCILNFLASLLTAFIVFPSLLNPKSSADWIAMTAIIFCLQLTWWLFLAVSPIAFAIFYAAEKDFSLINYWKSNWK